MMENAVQKVNVPYVVLASIVGLILLSLALSAVQFGVSPIEFSGATMELAAKLGIKLTTAGVIIDLLAGGSTVWAVVAIVFGISGAGVAVTAAITAAKSLIKTKGKEVAKAW